MLGLVLTGPALAGDRIALSCFGGMTGGGRVTSITPDGTITRYDCHGPGPGTCDTPASIGSDPAAYASWTAALDRAGFDTIDRPDSPGNVNCALLRERSGQTHQLAFTGLPDSPGNLPGPVAAVVRGLGAWHNRR